MKKKKQKAYDHRANDRYKKYITKRYRNTLRNPVFNLVSTAIPIMEQDRSAFCEPVIINHRDIAKYACINKGTVSGQLNEAKDAGLIELLMGEPVKNGGRSTVLRRYTIDELKANPKSSTIIDDRAPHARKLKQLLNSRTFVYGDNPDCKPTWGITKTNRLVSAGINVQGHKKELRPQQLCAGLQEGELLFYLDVKRADPTVLQHLLDYHFNTDPYDLLASINGIKRDDAKIMLNNLAYCATSSVKYVQRWSPVAVKHFVEYAQRLDDYKQVLFEKGKPDKCKRRHVDTIGGHRMIADKGNSPNRGKALSWQVQASVSDYINPSCLEIIKRETAEGWRLCFPVHDAVFVIGLPKHAKAIGKHHY